ncbi:MAG TPA: type IV toxin-antitoxin system AbiEi family antitoxin domain-containing protein [Rhabdochlamydiaceae bacterium]|nr:type IV toxin-antitoxin system AbiEi family antitoxin domain-containing protein [Rhabdochlamydiaceae bacterium]
MKQSKYQKLLNPLLKKPIFKASEARDRGIPSRMLAHFCKKGMIERVGRGLYRVGEAFSGIDLDFEELVLTVSSIPRGVICLISALSYYNLTDQVMREYWIAIPNADKSPKRPHTRIIRMRNMTLGLTTVKMGKYRVKIFDRERTIVDAFRYLSDEIAIKALQAYLKSSKKIDLPKLSRYAKALRININSSIMALTT